jgi:WD40 repeat protein
LPIYAWEMASSTVATGGALITDLQWSDAGDRLAVSTSDGPVQQWDVASGVLLWSASL